MSSLELGKVLLRPDVLPRILGDYHGPFSLGVIGSKSNREQPAILLRVQTRKGHQFSDCVEIDGQRFVLKVEEGFEEPLATS